MPGLAQLTGTSDVFDMALSVWVGLQGIAGGMPDYKEMQSKKPSDFI